MVACLKLSHRLEVAKQWLSATTSVDLNQTILGFYIPMDEIGSVNVHHSTCSTTEALQHVDGQNILCWSCGSSPISQIHIITIELKVSIGSVEETSSQKTLCSDGLQTSSIVSLHAICSETENCQQDETASRRILRHQFVSPTTNHVCLHTRVQYSRNARASGLASKLPAPKCDPWGSRLPLHVARPDSCPLQCHPLAMENGTAAKSKVPHIPGNSTLLDLELPPCPMSSLISHRPLRFQAVQGGVWNTIQLHVFTSSVPLSRKLIRHVVRVFPFSPYFDTSATTIL